MSFQIVRSVRPRSLHPHRGIRGCNGSSVWFARRARRRAGSSIGCRSGGVRAARSGGRRHQRFCRCERIGEQFGLGCQRRPSYQAQSLSKCGWAIDPAAGQRRPGEWSSRRRSRASGDFTGSVDQRRPAGDCCRSGTEAGFSRRLAKHRPKQCSRSKPGRRRRSTRGRPLGRGRAGAWPKRGGSVRANRSARGDTARHPLRERGRCGSGRSAVCRERCGGGCRARGRLGCCSPGRGGQSHPDGPAVDSEA